MERNLANDLAGLDHLSVPELRHRYARLFGEPLIIGTPDDAIRALEDYQARTRVTHLVMGTAMPGIEPRKVRASLELFAKEVMPHFRRKARASRKRG